MSAQRKLRAFRLIGRTPVTSFRLEVWIEDPENPDAGHYSATANAQTLDAALTYAAKRGGMGRITKRGNLVGYWGGFPKEAL